MNVSSVRSELIPEELDDLLAGRCIPIFSTVRCFVFLGRSHLPKTVEHVAVAGQQ